VVGLPAVTVVGLNWQFASAGKPVQAKLMVPENPPTAVLLIVIGCDDPCATVREVEAGDRVKPDTVTTAGTADEEFVSYPSPL
jgi:hypothetical protein